MLPGMAQKIITVLTDVTGEEPGEITTHTHLLDGAGVEIDLSSESFDQLQDVLGSYLRAGGARRVRGGATASRGRTAAAPRSVGPRAEDTAKIRAWAKAKGYEVSDRGRVPASIKEGHGNAHG
jgi:hypothetical protein